MELLRYVTLDVGGRPSVVLDLNDMTVLAIARESFKATPASKSRLMSAAERRYGGSRQVGEITDNGMVSWSTLVAGTTADTCIATLEGLLAQAEANPLPLLLEWRPDGASQSAYYDVRGTADWTSNYEWAQFAGAQSLIVEIAVPVAPLARGLPYDIFDGFDVDTRSDYTYDSGTAAQELVGNGLLGALSSPTVEKRAAHTARGYQYADSQQTIKGYCFTEAINFKLGVLIKRSSAATYLEAYVDDTGLESRLRIDKVIGGVRTNVATINLVARITPGTGNFFWVRGRIEGNTVTAEYFATANTPTPMGTPTQTVSYTLAVGEERTNFGAGVEGSPGRVWVPRTTFAAIMEYTVEPYSYRNQTLPETLVLGGTTPGDAPATADITVTPSGGAAAPLWGLLGWGRKPTVGLAEAPFGIIEAQTASNRSGWASEAVATARGGKMLRDTAALVSDVYTASWTVDPATLLAEDFTAEIAVEVWARVLIAPTIVTPTLTLSTRPEDGLSYGSARYTDEWGNIGRLLTVPTGGSEWRFTRLGTLRMLVDPLRPRKWLLWLAGTVGAGTSGQWGVDYLILVPGGSRACSPSGKPNDAGYPPFVSSTGETSKTIKNDLSALVAKPPQFGHPDHGLGGQLLELPPGESQLLVKLSSLVPDDPTANTTSEQLAHTATVHVAVTPRWQLVRSGN